MKAEMPELICIVGPTAIGKTSLSIKLAQYFSTEILSADSRQFYREMAIGTAVPSNEELEAVKHHFIQHISVEEDYNVGRYEKDAITTLKQIFKNHSNALLVGGSGLYHKAVTQGLDQFPDIPKSTREKYTTIFELEGIEKLQSLLKEKDPETYATIDRSNPRRLTRALEVIDTSGVTFSQFQKKKKANRNFDITTIGLDAPRPLIYERIEKRVDSMIDDGLIDEARLLYPKKHLNALQTVGYKELFRHFDGEISLAEAVAEIKKNTRRYAKRQLTWFKKNPNIIWLSYNATFADVLKTLNNKKAGHL